MLLVFILGFITSQIVISVKESINSTTDSPTELPEIQKNVIPKDYIIDNFLISKNSDRDKPGDVHSRIFSVTFTIGSMISGISPDVLRVTFDQRAEIVGVLISVDHTDPHVTLAEFEARTNVENSGYGNEGMYDALIHTSFACKPNYNCYGKTDEHIWFGKNSGIEVGSDDWITFGSWMLNIGNDKATVSPEFIVWYRWIE